MNNARMRQELLALKASNEATTARIDALLAVLGGGEGAENDTAEVVLMTQTEYAKRVGRDVGTIRKWVKAGMPHRKRGRLVLIDVKQADAWDQRAAVARSADNAAHRGSR